MISALVEIDQNGVPEYRHAQDFDLVYDGKKYPPKYAVATAGKYAREIWRSMFLRGRGGQLLSALATSLAPAPEPL